MLRNCSEIIICRSSCERKASSDVAGAGVEQADMRADADRYSPISRCLLLGDDHRRTAIEDDELVGLPRGFRQFAHQRRGVGDQPAHRRVQLCEAEQFQRQ